MKTPFGHRRAAYIDISENPGAAPAQLPRAEAAHLDTLDLIYRSLCALMFNYVPTSGHPGGSISSGRFVAGILFDAMDYDVARPDREDADIISYAAGHKALGLYAMWALRNEALRIGAPDLLPHDPRMQMRLEDLLGFRRNPVNDTPLFKEFGSKALDGHPTPATPFVKLSTGASGVGVAASIGLAIGAKDYFGKDAPQVHIVEGEGGLTPGRVSEALAAASAAGLDNVLLHVDWNQASIDSNNVCRDGETPGDYVQWDPAELAYLHDWNVVYVPDGKNIGQVVAGQRAALAIANGLPTAIIYRTVKGWKYGIEGRASHGAGHKLCSEGFYQALAEMTGDPRTTLPTCEATNMRCAGIGGDAVLEECFWEALTVVRRTMEKSRPAVDSLASRLRAARERLDARARKPRALAPRLQTVFEIAGRQAQAVPEELVLSPGASTTLRGELGRALEYLNRASQGALLVSAADLLGSTSVNTAAGGFPAGFWNAAKNPGARLMAMGGICEDAMSGVLSGISTSGRHIGVGSSYGAFLAPLGHIASRLHAIGSQARRARTSEPYNPMILVCAHAGLKTGEDGPTHADPQALQLLQENFPRGTVITLTPWDPQEIWTLLCAALGKRPAMIAVFVTRPSERILDRAKLGLAPASAAAGGLYPLRRARGKGDGTIVLQESGVAYAFIEGALPLLEKDGVDLNVFYVASAELFDLLPRDEQLVRYPEERAREAIGITGFTLPTMYRWVQSEAGRSATLHPFMKGHYPGSGAPEKVLQEMGLDGEGLYRAVSNYLHVRKIAAV